MVVEQERPGGMENVRNVKPYIDCICYVLGMYNVVANPPRCGDFFTKKHFLFGKKYGIIFGIEGENNVQNVIVIVDGIDTCCITWCTG